MSRGVRFVSLEVRRMPGFPRGELAVNSLAAGVNVVFGPNASGKTTLARAMQRMLRAHAAQQSRDSLRAEMIIGQEAYEVDCHLGQSTCRSRGKPVAVPTLAPAEVEGRYVLALHDLLLDEGHQDIAKQILREAAGGYDLPAAAESTGFTRVTPRNRALPDYKSLQNAITDRRKCETQLQQIQQEEDRLADLRQQRDEAREAQSRATLCKQALAALEKRHALDVARRAVEQFPTVLKKMRGDELLRLSDLDEKIETAERRLSDESRRLEDARKAMQDARMPEPGIDPETSAALINRSASLRELAGERHRAEAELIKCEAQLSQVVSSLGSEVSPKQVESLDAVAVEKLLKVTVAAVQHRAEKEAEDRLHCWLTEDAAPSHTPEQLHEGQNLLHRWLSNQPPGKPADVPNKRPWFIAAGVTAAVAVAMALLVHLSWLGLLLVSVGLAGWALRPVAPQAPSVAEQIPQQWTDIGLPPPDAWSPPEVQARLRDLRSELTAAQLHQQKAARFADLEPHRRQLGKKLEELTAVCNQWRAALGVEIDIAEPELHYLSATVQRVQQARESLKAAQAKRDELHQQHDALLSQINEELQPYNASPCEDAERTAAAAQHLEHRRQAYQQAGKDCDGAQRAIKQSQDELDRLRQDREALFTALDLTSQEAHTLCIYADQLPAYQNATEAVRRTEYELKSALEPLENHSELKEESPQQLQAELDQCRDAAGGLDDLVGRIATIEDRVQRAKQEHALEAALAEEERCRDQLRAAAARDAGEMIGKLLVDHLSRQQRDEQQPGVLTRASELFLHITHGRYRLIVEHGDPPRFRAVDTSQDAEQSLEQLSSGTRLQLLLAVRVAFVEQQEQGLMLPLIFDETLGNSDEQRAGNIIQSAIKLAQSGRQVFYFTAQHDELGKWRRALRDRQDVEHCEIDLARLRNFQPSEHAPAELDQEPARRLETPSPNGDDWISYGKRLEVRLDPRAPVAGVHLWYLIDDVDQLYRLLKHDINNWGQLQALVELNLAEGLTLTSPVYQRAEAAARLLKELLWLRKQGRGEPIDRAVLDDSGAVTLAFIDQVSGLAESLEGDARRLIDALKEREVSGFRKDKIANLETYLAESGFLDDAPVLDVAEIRERILPRVFDDCEKGLLNGDRVEQLLTLVVGQSEPVATNSRSQRQVK